MPLSSVNILAVILVLLALCLLVSIIMRLTRCIVLFLLLLILVSAAYTITWGDGSAYVSKFASLFSPQIEEQINDGYRFYRAQSSQEPIIDTNQIESYADDAVSAIEKLLQGHPASEPDRVFKQ